MPLVQLLFTLTCLSTIMTKFLFNLTDADGLGIPIGNRRLHLRQEILGIGNFGKVVKGELIGDNGSEAVAVKMLRGDKNYLH